MTMALEIRREHADHKFSEISLAPNFCRNSLAQLNARLSADGKQPRLRLINVATIPVFFLPGLIDDVFDD